MLALSYLGWDSFPIARLGNDPAGEAVLSDLHRFGVRDDYIIREEGTGTPIIVERLRHDVPEAPRHSYSCTCPECGGWFPRYRPITRRQAASLEGSRFDVYYFDRAAPGTVLIAERLRESGDTLIVFEPASIGGDRLFERAVAASHIVKYSHERLGRSDRLRDCLDALVLVETLGADGIRVRAPGSASWLQMPSYNVRGVVDTAGAGDWCTTGLLYWLWQNDVLGPESLTEVNWPAAAAFAQALAAISCTYESPRGAMYELPAGEMLASARSIACGDVFTLKGRPSLSPSQREQLSLYCQACSL
jgi:fructokinase